MKCQCGGCKKEAAYRMTQTVGKKQSLLICEKCAPEWVKTGIAPKPFGDKSFYVVDRL